MLSKNQNKHGGFVAGTLVWTDKGLVPIEQLKVGDMVLSKSDVTEEVAYKRVTRTFVMDDKEITSFQVCSVQDVQGERIGIYDFLFSTSDHPVWLEERGWTPFLEAYTGKDSFLGLLHDGKAVVDAAESVYALPDQPDVGAIMQDRWEEELCLPLCFDTSIRTVPVPDSIPRRYNGATPLEHRYMDEFYADEAERIPFRTRVYNIEVEEFHSHFIGELGLMVHDISSR